MKKFFYLIWITFLMLCSHGQAQEVFVPRLSPLPDNMERQQVPLNGQWLFHTSPEKDFWKKERILGWETIEVPGEWVMQGFNVEKGKTAGYYRTFTVPESWKGKRIKLRCNGIYSDSRVYINGKEAGSHLGGFTAFELDVTALIYYGEENRIAVSVVSESLADSTSNGSRYAVHPLGGIVRDLYLFALPEVNLAMFHISTSFDTLYTDATLTAEIAITNESKSEVGNLSLHFTLTDAEGNQVPLKSPVHSLRKLLPGLTEKQTINFDILRPVKWDSEHPYLYTLTCQLKENRDVLHTTVRRVGFRQIEVRGNQMFINNMPVKLRGVCRHEVMPLRGRSLNGDIWKKDVELFRRGNVNYIRTSHYPPDEALLEACDELGMFVIVATPGWQYWNKEPEFARLVHENTRQMIRRDRNHACVLMWEPILNETRYPLDFALEALRITKEEYPYPGRPVAAADVHSAGVEENYDVVYGWPGDDEKTDSPEQCIFTREYGENVDDWYAHNNNNRASRSWGERPLLVQALSLAKSYDEMYRTTGKFIGGAQWHPFDHQRGYHPDPYWGGIFDAFRQPKYAYHMYRSQTAPDLNHPLAECGPVVYIAHEMSQFSDADVVVFSNCDSVRLSVYDGTKSWTLPVIHAKGHMPNAPVVFKNVWNFWEARDYSYVQKKWQKVNILAEGIINGKVVCAQKKMPSRRSTKLRLRIDSQGVPLVADGSDFVVVIAEVTDDNGNVRRLAKENIVFTIEGEGEIIGDRSINANPRTVEFGTAPVLVRSTSKAGKIRIKAHVQFEGTHAPTPAEIEFESVDPELPSCYIEQRMVPKSNVNPVNNTRKTVLTEEEKRHLLMEVEKQQTEFGVNSEK